MNILNKLANIAAQRVNKYGAQYYTFAVFIIINFPLAYLFEINSNKLTAELWPRLIPTLLGLILFFKDKWPVYLKKFLPLFWYISIIFALPLLGSFMIFKNNFSLEWVINFNIGVVMIMMLVDVVSFIIVESIGIIIGFALYYILGNSSHEAINTEFLPIFFYMFFCIVILGSIFTRNKETYSNFLQNAKDALNYDLELKVAERTIELREALATKNEFLNNMSHEIRTPMQGFLAISEGLVEHWHELIESKKLDLAAQVANNAKRLSLLLNNILELSVFTEEKIKLDFSRINLKQMIEKIINNYKNLYSTDKIITIEFEMNTTSVSIEADKIKLNKVICELITNAIKFSQNNSIISVFLNEIKNQDGRKDIYFKISDSGVGVPKNELNYIFDSFTQSSRTKTEAGGTGLGLSIAKKIIEAHNGKIWASNNINQGASFHFIIPVSQEIKLSEQ